MTHLRRVADCIPEELCPTISMTFHPLLSEKQNVEQSIRRTIDYLSVVQTWPIMRRFKICLENLNNYDGIIRPHRPDVIRMLRELSPDYGFVYDAGHDLVDNMLTGELEYELEEKLNCFHIHQQGPLEDRIIYYVKSAQIIE